MSTAAKYKRHAANCLRFARLMSAPRDRALLTEMAAMWLRLADRAEIMSELLEGIRVMSQDIEREAGQEGPFRHLGKRGA
jgi:hypothetical protein